MVENQHRKITGYRDLTEAEIALMNEIKAYEQAIAKLHKQVVAMVNATEPHAGKTDAQRQASIARTELEGGFMRLVRAVAQPMTPWGT